MIFVLAKNEPRLILMLAEKDVATMRKGLTVFVDQHQLKGATFNGVTLALFSNDDAAMKAIKDAGHNISAEKIVTPKPTIEEETCAECGGIMAKWMLLNDRCIVCWRQLAIRWMGHDPSKNK